MVGVVGVEGVGSGADFGVVGVGVVWVDGAVLEVAFNAVLRVALRKALRAAYEAAVVVFVATAG